MATYTIRKQGSGYKAYKGLIALTSTVTKAVAQAAVKEDKKREAWRADPKAQAKAKEANRKRLKYLGII